MNSIQYSDDPRLRTAQKVAFWVVIGLGGVVLFGLLFGLLIQFLWNVTLASMFELPGISFWQAVGLFVLAKLLFGFGSSSPNSGRRRSRKWSGRGKKAVAGEGSPESESELVEIPDDEDFRTFWQDEGKEAYDAYVRRRDSHLPSSGANDLPE